MKRPMLIAMIASLSFGPLPAAGWAHGAASRPIKAKFICKNGARLTVLFEGNKATVTSAGSKPVVLRQALAADGFLYTKSRYRLRGRGDWVSWATGSGKPLDCYSRH